MGQGIDGALDDQCLALGPQDERIDDGDVGNQGPGNDRHLYLPGHVGDDAELRDVGAAARRGGDQDHGRQWPLHLVRPLIVTDPAAIAGENGDPLGRVHRTAAADGNDDVRPVLQVHFGTLLDLEVPGVRGHTVIIDPLDPLLFEDVHEPLQPAGLLDSGITDQKNLFGSEPEGALTGIIEAAPAKDNLRDCKFGYVHLCHLLTIHPANCSYHASDSHPARSFVRKSTLPCFTIMFKNQNLNTIPRVVQVRQAFG